MTSQIQEKTFLIIDCQTTGMNAKNSYIIDIAWAIWKVNEPLSIVENYLMRLPEGAIIPRQIQQLTGITQEQLVAGSDSPAICLALENALTTLGQSPIIVSHYAQFEYQFLKELFYQHHQALLPFEMICTQKIAKKILTGIPSLTLAGIAGYLGIDVAKLNRAASHVKATYAIWSSLMGLMQKLSISTVEELKLFLNSKNTNLEKKYDYRVDRLKRLNLTTQPGIYRMLNQQGKVLYVGKASSLKSRVNSYFRGVKKRNRRIHEMLAQVWKIDIVACDTPLEAALLEADEIKNHVPPYNVLLKNADRIFYFYDKKYSSISLQQNSVYCLGPYRPFSAIDNLINLSQWIKTGNNDLLMFKDLSANSIEAGFNEFCQNEKLMNGKLKEFSIRQLICLAITLLRKHCKDELKNDFEKSWAQQKKMLKSQSNYEEIINTSSMVADKFKRIFLRAAKAVQRTKTLTRLLNSEVFVTTGIPKVLTFHQGRLTDIKPATNYPWQDATIAELDRMSILLTEVTKNGYRVTAL
jgi:DNA polymerase-3 subunit epsilon